MRSRLEKWRTSLRDWDYVSLLGILAIGLVFIFKTALLFTGPKLGSDYCEFVPELGAFLFWIQNNGFFVAPHFLPFQCGGSFEFANPQGQFYTFATFIAQYVPFNLVFPLTTILPGIFGGVGAFLLAKLCLKFSRYASLLVGFLFLCNHFFLIRMAVGHLGFNSFPLWPWIAFFCLIEFPQVSRWAQYTLFIQSACFIALANAYMIYSGCHICIAISAIGIPVILFSARKDFKAIVGPLARFGLGGFLGLCMSSYKLFASLSLMKILRRDYYPIPGFSDLLTTTKFFFYSLFFDTQSNVNIDLENIKWGQDYHERIYGVSAVPLILLLIMLGFLLRRSKWKFSWRGGKKLWRPLLIFVLLFIPIAFNTYSPEWHAVLKSIPVIGRSSALLRWGIIYILPLSLLSGAVFNTYLEKTKWRRLLFLLLTLWIGISYWQFDTQPVFEHGYNPDVVTDKFMGSERSEIVPITQLGYGSSRYQGEAAFLEGTSQMQCYNPIFGYARESLRIDNLRLGSVKTVLGGDYNFHNPACYVFPEANHCSPGDNFKVNQEENLDRLTHYSAMNYEEPQLSEVLFWVSLLTFFGSVLVCFSWLYQGLRMAMSSRV
jgi:hypothetical protein